MTRKKKAPAPAPVTETQAETPPQFHLQVLAGKAFGLADEPIEALLRRPRAPGPEHQKMPWGEEMPGNQRRPESAPLPAQAALLTRHLDRLGLNIEDCAAQLLADARALCAGLAWERDSEDYKHRAYPVFLDAPGSVLFVALCAWSAQATAAALDPPHRA